MPIKQVFFYLYSLRQAKKRLYYIMKGYFYGCSTRLHHSGSSYSTGCPPRLIHNIKKQKGILLMFAFILALIIVALLVKNAFLGTNLFAFIGDIILVAVLYFIFS